MTQAAPQEDTQGRAQGQRRVAWIVVGLAGLPAAALGVLYVYSLVILPGAFAFGLFYNAWGWTHYVFTAFSIVVLLLFFGFSIVGSLPTEGLDGSVVWGLMIGVSAVCAVASAEKLGRMVGDRWARPPRALS